ncbi:hypothetical protein BOX15_Mlig009245g1 [Macrostomum lignano]|uniref:Pyrroline-5-carboxylate reductase n=1 Tax=Macrostomum lignano TaxID=282301 RepID=A0A267EYI5_9PLAT|nr:hypothetical protein BOX15_Mlig009245g1 [Macrostomum lignano]
MRIGFVGAGRMAQAIAKGFTSRGIIKSRNIWASDRAEKTLERISTELRINVTHDNREVVEHSDILVLSVKPQVMDTVLAELSDLTDPSKLVVSVAAGVTLDHLQSRLLPDSRVIRLMPNTPILANAGASVYCVGKATKPEDGPLIEALFKSVGTCDYLPENLMDAATGLSGSGPAFIFEAIDAMTSAGVQMGLPLSLAQRLVCQTVHGAGLLALQSGQSPAELRDAITSPGGTTIAGLSELEARGFRAALWQAVMTSAKRSAELGSGINDPVKPVDDKESPVCTIN